MNDQPEKNIRCFLVSGAAWVAKLSEKGILALLIIISVLARVAAALYMGDQVTELPGIFDQISYHALAGRVLGGHGFSFGQDWWPITRANSPTAHWSFLYTFYLCAVYSVFGPHPLAARILQAVVVGILQPYLTYLLGRQIFSAAAGLIGAGLSAVYIYFIYYSGALMTEPFYITAILGSLYLAIRITGQPAEMNVQRAILLSSFGLVLGSAVLLRQLFLLFIPFLLVWMIWRSQKQHRLRLTLHLALPIMILAGMILPFTVYNYNRFGRLVLLNTNAGYAFFWGNHPIYGTKFLGILPREMGSYEALIPEELRGLDEAALEKALMLRGLQFIREDPARFLILSLSRIPVYFQFWPSRESGLISNISRVGSFGILWPFMLYGLVRIFLDGYTAKRKHPVWVLALFAGVYSGIHLLSWALIRYRLPVDAVLLVFAAYAFADVSRRFRWARIAGTQKVILL